MPFRILCAVAALPERCGRQLLNDRRSCLLGPSKVLVHVLDINEQALRRSSQFSRVLIVRSWPAHHHHIITESHGRMLDLAARSADGRTMLAKAKCFSEKFLHGRHVGVIKISSDRHRSKEVKELEARVGIEPTHKGFADLSLTAW